MLLKMYKSCHHSTIYIYPSHSHIMIVFNVTGGIIISNAKITTTLLHNDNAEIGFHRAARKQHKPKKHILYLLTR